MQHQLWEMVARQRYEEMLREADEERRLRPAPVGTLVGQVLVDLGRGIERIGRRFGGLRLNDTSVAGGLR